MATVGVGKSSSSSGGGGCRVCCLREVSGSGKLGHSKRCACKLEAPSFGGSGEGGCDAITSATEGSAGRAGGEEWWRVCVCKGGQGVWREHAQFQEAIHE
eukprot:scaffold162048_cov12-Tisochrysis_lutea.AAC.1